MEEQIKTNYIETGYIINPGTDNEEIIQIPYNINNFLVTEQNILDILENNNIKLDTINNIKVFQQAFTHKSYIQKNLFPEQVLIDAKNELGNPSKLLELQEKSYERLEYLGDRVLKLIVSFYLFYRYLDCDEGFMTRLQTKIEDKTNLAEMSKTLGLSKYFIISRQFELLDGRSKENIHEDVFESFIGALFLSQGFETCCNLIVNLLETLIDYSEKLYRDNNYKDILLRYYHSQKWGKVIYNTLVEVGPPNKRTYVVGIEEQNSNKNIELRDRCIAFGKGSSKKEAEQNSAKMFLILYNQLERDQYDDSDLLYPNWDDYVDEEEDINQVIGNLIDIQADNNILSLIGDDFEEFSDFED